jgi:hypothetical protein
MDVQRLAAEDRLALTLSACDAFISRLGARRWIKDLIATLRPEDFAHSVQLEVHRADVYGVYNDGCGWYVKLTMTKDTDGLVVLVISCHLVERPLKTLKRTILP